MRHNIFTLAAITILLACTSPSQACTGITLKAADGSTVVARTIEWNASDLNSMLVVVPRGYTQRLFSPSGKKDGMELTSKMGYIGLATELEEFIAEGLNEEGLSAGLFYFPAYGEYEKYRPENRSTTVGDLQLVSWILGNFKTVDEVVAAFGGIHVVTIDSRASTAHWRIADKSGRQVVLEIVGGKPVFHENSLGVLTNAPGFEWHSTNLNNYVNLYSGTAVPKDMGAVRLRSFGSGSGMLGLPGDFTPPSRFIRAAFYQSTAPRLATADKTVMQCFQILNNFDIPVGTGIKEGAEIPDIPSATQWTSATDIVGRKIYYRTMYNSDIRCIDLGTVDFAKTKYQVMPLDKVKKQHVTVLNIK
ncbi:linear amide C-N hydrolase [Xylanibacter muris]|uniref:Choloylglycine hydrolase family protein n=1 Tax=Xylanibacter muris TaxID=2736290 RepID=A0ABX2AIP6_9BACT|nr:choloylglycine hydrolase family protein [Xylanibacter muris]NPD90919.1 choloylglycine hydrolase family protein [Xylanibacter muris]